MILQFIHTRDITLENNVRHLDGASHGLRTAPGQNMLAQSRLANPYGRQTSVCCDSIWPMRVKRMQDETGVWAQRAWSIDDQSSLPMYLLSRGHCRSMAPVPADPMRGRHLSGRGGQL